MKYFKDYLDELMFKKNLSAVQIYKKIWMQRQTFHKILNSKGIPHKTNVCHIAMAMRLDLKETMDLLQQAGYGLSDFIVYDRCVKQMLTEGYTDEELEDFVLEFSEDKKIA